MKTDMDRLREVVEQVKTVEGREKLAAEAGYTDADLAYPFAFGMLLAAARWVVEDAAVLA